MADYAVDISKAVSRVQGINFSEDVSPVWEMVDIVTKMIKSAIEAIMAMLIMPMKYVIWMIE